MERAPYLRTERIGSEMTRRSPQALRLLHSTKLFHVYGNEPAGIMRLAPFNHSCQRSFAPTRVLKTVVIYTTYTIISRIMCETELRTSLRVFSIFVFSSLIYESLKS